MPENLFSTRGNRFSATENLIAPIENPRSATENLFFAAENQVFPAAELVTQPDNRARAAVDHVPATPDYATFLRHERKTTTIRLRSTSHRHLWLLSSPAIKSAFA